MDLSAYSTKSTAENTHKETIINPNTGLPFEHEGKEMYAIVVSKNSKSYKNSFSRIVNAARRADKYGEQDYEVPIETMKKANLCGACTRKLFIFHNNEWIEIENDGSEDDAGKHKIIRDIYIEYNWMLDQVDLAIGKTANFLGRSEPISSSI